jgi:hypothetical protein
VETVLVCVDTVGDDGGEKELTMLYVNGKDETVVTLSQLDGGLGLCDTERKAAALFLSQSCW